MWLHAAKEIEGSYMQVRVGFGLEDYAENLVDLCCDHDVGAFW